MATFSLQLFSELVNGEGQLCYPLAVEVMGKVKGGRLAVRLYGQEEDIDVAKLLIKAGCAKEQSQNCIFGLEAEVELELFWGKTKASSSGQMEVLPPLTEMVKKDARLTKGNGNARERGNEGKSQDLNANVQKSVAEVTNAKEVVAEKTNGESLGVVDCRKFVKDKPQFEAEKPEENRSIEEKPDRSKKSPLETQNPVARKNLEGRSIANSIGRPAKPKVEDRPEVFSRHQRLESENKLEGEKVAECKSGKNCKWKPRCRFAHYEGGNEEQTRQNKATVDDKPIVEKKLLKVRETANEDKASEIKDNQVDLRKLPEEEKPPVEVKLARDRDCVVEQNVLFISI